jgi:hypothetical protein
MDCATARFRQAEIRELRDLTRQRVHFREDSNKVKNRIEQVCQTGHIKISPVATDLFGLSGRKMLKAFPARAYVARAAFRIALSSPGKRALRSAVRMELICRVPSIRVARIPASRSTLK